MPNVDDALDYSSENASVISNENVNSITNDNVVQNYTENCQNATNVSIPIINNEPDTTNDDKNIYIENLTNEHSKFKRVDELMDIGDDARLSNKFSDNVICKPNDSVVLNNVEVYKLQIESLEQLLDEQRQEVASLTERLRQQTDRISDGDRRGRDMEIRMETMRKQVENCTREKDATVMRYAVSEKSVIDERNAKETAVRAERQARAEVELLNSKVKTALSEKTRICRMLDEKVHEVSQSQKDSTQLKKDLHNAELKLKWTQNKLHNEMDAYREATNQSEKLQQQLSTLQAEKEQFQNNQQEATRAKELELQLKEVQAMLILEKHDKVKAESKLKQANVASDAARSEANSAKEEIQQLRAKVEQLMVENGELETRATEVTALKTRAAQCDTLIVQLERERERTTSLQDETAAMRASESDAREKAVEACKRETAALEHLQRLTSDNIQARTKCMSLENKLSELLPKFTTISSELESSRGQLSLSQRLLDEESLSRRRDSELLARRVAETTKECDELRKQLDWQTGDNLLLKKKNANTVKELTKELQKVLKRCEILEAKLPPQSITNVGDSVSNKTGSTSSLSSYDGVVGANSSEPNSNCADVNGRLSEDGTLSQDPQVREPSRQQLIERIVSLQRSLAKCSERVEFLEEHSRQLTSELRNKSKLVRTLSLKYPTGAMVNTHSDQNKADVARRGGGVMAAVYGAEPDDDSGMTLSLSLEMNRKLQAVLEDALLKNITLEDNIETLGNEIERLLASKRSTSSTLK